MHKPWKLTGNISDNLDECGNSTRDADTADPMWNEERHSVNSQFRHWLWNGLRLTVVLGIFFYLYQTNQFSMMKVEVAAKHPGMIAMILALVLTGFIISVQRWRLLLQIQNVQIAFWPAFQLSCIGLFSSMVLPGAVSGDIVKGYYLVRGQNQKTVLASSILVDRLIGLYTVIAVAALAVFFCFVRDGITINHGIWSVKSVRALAGFVSVIGLGLTLTVFCFLLAGTRLREWLYWCCGCLPLKERTTRIITAMMDYTRYPVLTIYAILLSVAAQMPVYLGMGILAQLLGAQGLAAADYLFILPVCVVINSIPIAPGGWGVGEAGFRSVFLLYGSEVGAETAFVLHVITFMLAAGLGSAAYVLWNRRAVV